MTGLCVLSVFSLPRIASPYIHTSLNQQHPSGSSPQFPDPEGSLPTSERPRLALCSELLEDTYLFPLQRHQWGQPLSTASGGMCQAQGALAGSRGRRLQDSGFQGRWSRGLICAACMRHSSRVLKSMCEKLEEGPETVLKTQQQSREVASEDLV